MQQIAIDIAAVFSVTVCTFLRCPSTPHQEIKLYEEVHVASLDELTGIVEMALEEYNNTHENRINLVIFRYGKPHVYVHVRTYQEHMHATDMCLLGKVCN